MLGVCELISFAMSGFISMPHSWAIAGIWSILLVEQPSAISAVRAFLKAASVIMSRGRIFLRYSSITCIPASFARRIRPEYTAGIVPFPPRAIPRTSVRQFMEFAVYIPEHEPQVGQALRSKSHTSSIGIFPAV